MGTQALTLLEVFEEDGAVDGEVADYGELGEGREGDGLVFVGAGELVYERGAGHRGLAVDEHGAGAADLFEAVGVVGDGRGGLAGDVDGVERDLAEERGDVHVRAIGDLELLGGGGGVRVGLALDLDFDGAWHLVALYGLISRRCWVGLCSPLIRCRPAHGALPNAGIGTRLRRRLTTRLTADRRSQQNS